MKHLLFETINNSLRKRLFKNKNLLTAKIAEIFR